MVAVRSLLSAAQRSYVARSVFVRCSRSSVVHWNEGGDDYDDAGHRRK